MGKYNIALPAVPPIFSGIRHGVSFLQKTDLIIFAMYHWSTANLCSVPLVLRLYIFILTIFVKARHFFQMKRICGAPQGYCNMTSCCILEKVSSNQKTQIGIFLKTMQVY